MRYEFIGPFFEALGWDVRNTQGYAEAYKDVVYEESVRIGAGMEAPDYTFRIGGARKFFVEAKKPSVSLGGDSQGTEQHPQAKTVLKRQIETTDHKIEALVYALYGLTEEEIHIVEGTP